jgi:predicted GNAT family acetyltransferase
LELLDEGKIVRIEVETENDVAISLYRSCGFRPIVTYLYYELQL